jgi:WhiB family redox-sensing transcriptional regulator
VSWHFDAACRDADPALFFGPDHEALSVRLARETKARAVCAGCPVRADCLNDALRGGVTHGVWGGYGEGDPARATNVRQIAAPRVDLRVADAAERRALGEKFCPACEQTKPLDGPDGFALAPKKPDGHAGRCKACMRTYFADRKAAA